MGNIMNANLPNDASRPTIYRPPAVRINYSPTEETFQRILDNDPDVPGVCFKCSENLSDLAGRAISQSIHLRWVEVYCSPLINYSPQLLAALFMQIAENRSIEHLEISRTNMTSLIPSAVIFGNLAPFFRHNQKLRCIDINHSKIPEGIGSLITAVQVSRELRLERINLSYCNIGDERIGELIDAFTNSPGLCHLLELCLSSNLVGQRGCTAIGKLLTRSECSVRTLELKDNVLDDECINILVGAFIANNTLQKLGIEVQKFVTPTGWCVFSAYLSHPNCSFDKVCFREDHLDDSVLTSLGIALAINKKVTHLEIGHSQHLVATPLGWRAFSTCLRCPGSALQVLVLIRCNIDDDVAVMLAAALAEKTSVKELTMSDIRSISSSGWIDCLKLLLNSSTLKDITLSKNNIDDTGALILAHQLGNMGSLQILKLEHIENVTIDGWRAIADVLPFSTLKSLHLRGGDGIETICDDLVVNYANALTCNSRLREMSLNFPISDVGYNALVNALCDTSSIENTFASNHTLTYCHHGYTASIWSQSKLFELTQMNCCFNKSSVARRKILMHHFADEGNSVHIFSPMKIEVVPIALSWVGRDRLGYSLMYNSLRSMPWLLKSAQTPQSLSPKGGVLQNVAHKVIHRILTGMRGRT